MSIKSEVYDPVYPAVLFILNLKTPCNIGDPLMELETPSLLVCLKSLEFNLKKMTEAMKAYPNVNFRPHSKTHKCPMISRLQVMYLFAEV